ncbi:macrophage mannose receptor 1-like isoform X2 [Oratosquilla oratoria]|uniref:macrophage mannose receptor 1-like isoform X2 n=1 Tax=Oratosquilla oratoria TaxID=337810 RepID=UPI003F765D83
MTDKTYGKCGKCRVYDDPHFTTFDGKSYDWHVRCNFTLVELVTNEAEDFAAAVFSEFEDCSANYKAGPACVGTTVFKDTNTSAFTFKRGVNNKVWHNGEEHMVLGKTVLELEGASVWAINGGIRIHGVSSLLVEFFSTGSSALSVWAPPELSGKVSGLCGDFDGSKDNEFKDLSPFASSWMTEEQKVDCQPPQGDNPQMDLCAEKDELTISGYYETCEVKLKGTLSEKTEVRNQQLDSCVQDLCACINPEECLKDVADVTNNEWHAEALVFNGCVWEEIYYNNGSQHYIQCQLYLCSDGDWVRLRGTDPTCCRFNEATYRDDSSLNNMCSNLVCQQGRWEIKDEISTVPEIVDDESYTTAPPASLITQPMPTVLTTTTPKPILPPDNSFCEGIEVHEHEVNKLAECPVGWRALGKENAYCLFQLLEGQSWKDANSACQEINGTLADLSLPGEFEAVQEYLKGSGVTDTWVGATNWKVDVRYKWTWVSTNTGVNPSMWGRNTNLKGTTEQCMALAKDRNFLGAEKDCKLKLPFICSRIQYDPPCPVGFLYIEGGCYSVTTTAAVKSKAEENCKDIGASLAVFDSVAKWKAVGNYLTTSYGQVKPEYWVDGEKEGNALSEYWRWSNKKAIDPHLWYKGDDFTAGHNCLALNTAKDFTALDFPCTASKTFICETQPSYFISKNHSRVMCPDQDTANRGCGDSWIRIGNECYTMPQHTETWDQAKRSCESYGGSVAVFTKTSELKTVRNYLKLLDSDTIWIGGTNSLPDLKYTWVWINSVVVQEDVWEIGDPKKKTTSNLCLALQKGTLEAVEMACNIKNKFLCQKRVNSRSCPIGWMYAYGACFRFSSDKKKWEDACWTTNSALATFDDLNQWKAFQSVMARSANLATTFWVGASSDIDEHHGKWIWTSGAKVDYSLWKPGNVFEDASQCMYMDGTKGFKMGDYSCNSALNYVCQIKPLFYVDNDKKPVITDSMAGCPHGWEVLGEDCYYLANSTHYTDWNNARRTCNAYHGTLATFTDDKKFLEVHDYVKKSEHPSAWVGATNGLPDLQYMWVWVNGVLVSIDAWAPGKPTLKTSVGCMVLWSATDYQLQDITCSYKYSFICRKEQLGRACPDGWLYAGGSCLQKSTSKQSWENARLTCNSNNFNLAVLNSPQLWDAFQRSMAHSAKPDYSFWIGASDTLSTHNGIWTWLSGARVSNAAWMPANPFEANSHCMYVASSGNFLMGDDGCAKAMHYMCQREPNYYVDQDVPIKTSQSIDYMTGCPKGWNRIGRDCYYLADKAHYTNWNNAYQTCNSYHATLATFHNTSELEMVKEYIDIKDNVWIGATNSLPHLKYHWVWINNALVDHSFWTNDRPKAKTSLYCMALWASSSHLPVDVACTNVYSFLCRKGVEEPACPDGWFYAQGSCFSMSTAKKNWDQANETCGQAGTTLASFYDRNQWHVFQSSLARSAHLGKEPYFVFSPSLSFRCTLGS